MMEHAGMPKLPEAKKVESVDLVSKVQEAIKKASPEKLHRLIQEIDTSLVTLSEKLIDVQTKSDADPMSLELALDALDVRERMKRLLEVKTDAAQELRSREN